jgi:pimeloyl-ACP methyl ester carboxylesterase
MGFGFEIPVFGELAEALADAGYVVLRYDKRNCTVQTGCANAYPPMSGTGAVDDYVSDLKAGLDWLHTRPEVDAERLFYVGHSQGGQFAPELLASRSDLQAAVMLAGPYGSVDELIAYQGRFLRELVLSLGGVPDGPEQLALEQGVLELRQLREGTFAGSTIMGDSPGSWQSWMALGDRARTLVNQLDRPLLALSGDYDWNVPPSETDAWRDAFAAVSNDPGHEAVVLPCVSHALNCIGEPDLSLLDEDDFGRHIEPAVVAEIVRFLRLHGAGDME